MINLREKSKMIGYSTLAVDVTVVFSVTPFKIDQNKNQNCSIHGPESGKGKKVNMQTLANMQVTVIFLKQDMWRCF